MVVLKCIVKSQVMTVRSEVKAKGQWLRRIQGICGVSKENARGLALLLYLTSMLGPEFGQSRTEAETGKSGFV
jgi:hypothetical protein